jgi:UDP-glucuronate 4-epimerase
MTNGAILVTGGAGFIGSHLCERLAVRGNRVVCVDNFDPFYSPEVKKNNLKTLLANPLFTLIECDIRDRKGLENIFKTYTIDKVVHLAARAGVRPSINNPLLYQDVNIRGTLNLLELSKEYKIKNFIFASSSSVYGDCIHVPFKEDNARPHPISPYAASKQAGELFCYTYHHLYHIPITCLRFFTVYGPRQRPDMAIHKFARLVDTGKEIQIYGDGSSKRDYTYISDIIDGIVSALDNQFGFEIINLGNSKIIALKELVSLIENNLGKKARIIKIPPQPGDVPITYADITKAKKILNYNPEVMINKGIRIFVQWYKNNKI